jgi:hypothetical protein
MIPKPNGHREGDRSTGHWVGDGGCATTISLHPLGEIDNRQDDQDDDKDVEQIHG